MAEQTKAEKLLAEIEAKYGAPAAGPSEQVKIQAPASTKAVEPPPQPTQPGSMLQRAVGIFGDRKKQIDKAAGYACGGKIKAHAQGGKIVGPGTAKSDSIPAQVKETGEPILVSNGERIVSAKQDQLLQRIAQMLGFETVDQMFEKMTGEAVGPTMKDGVPAAADGATEEQLARQREINQQALDEALARANTPAAPASPPPGLNPDGSLKYQNVTPNQVGPLSMMGDAYSATAGKILPTPAARADAARAKVQEELNPTTPAPTSATPAAATPTTPAAAETKPATVSPMISGKTDKGLITDETASKYLGTDMRRSGGVFGTYDGKAVNDILARENAARAGMIDSMIKAQGGNGIGVLPDRTNDANEQLQAMRLNPAEYLKYLALKQGQANEVMKNDQNNLTIQRGQDKHLEGDLARAAKDPLDQRIKGLQIADAETTSRLRGIYLDKSLPQAERDAALAQLNALSGKKLDENFKIATVRKPDPNNPGQYIEEAYVVNGHGGQSERKVGGQQNGYPDGTRLKKVESGKEVIYIVKNGVPVKEGA